MSKIDELEDRVEELEKESGLGVTVQYVFAGIVGALIGAIFF